MGSSYDVMVNKLGKQTTTASVLDSHCLLQAR